MRVPGTILTVDFIKKSNPTSIHLGCVNFKLPLHETWNGTLQFRSVMTSKRVSM
jgi:hypothetical protein